MIRFSLLSTGCVLQLQSHGRVVKPYIGIKMLQLDAGKAEQLKRADASFPAVRAGILVPEVSQGSPAHRAGLQSGDVIVGESRLDEQAPACTSWTCLPAFVCFDALPLHPQMWRSSARP